MVLNCSQETTPKIPKQGSSRKQGHAAQWRHLRQVQLLQRSTC
ncbi:unnamed protein product [Linum tenue]|uniref:Uncharacterized protein n=1 Tax=Linum tenue TaxID=586396 RepID=A0AAV0KR11_9ROSI|nr:unnamed protein product [Linum tenue]